MKLNVFRKLKAIEAEPKKPRTSLAIDKGSKFVYKRGSDVMKLWKKHGFTPPSEYRDDYLFKKNREVQSE
jgi:hypothetical protein